jgi:hypothetical protein
MTDIMFPVGRMIGGSVYKMQPVLDNFGKPKMEKDGVTPRTELVFGVAFPKTPGLHWSQEPWGQQIAQIGAAAYPQVYNNPAFAWKINDGDSTTPNKRGNIPCNQEGYKGCWVVWFKQGWAPKLVDATGKITLTEPDSILPGYYVQVLANCVGNAPSPTPGVYINPLAIALAAYGERIVSAGVDTANAGFGQGALPPGASLTPIGGLQPVQQPAVGGVVAPQFQAGNVQMGVSALPAAQAGLAINAASHSNGFTPVSATGNAQTPPPPNHAILQIPNAPATPVMTAKAQGSTYNEFIAKGWTDQMLREHGYII